MPRPIHSVAYRERRRHARRRRQSSRWLREHRAADPHCTCNDCIAAHFEQPPARCRSCGAQAGEPTTREPWTCPDCLDAGL